MDTPAFRLREAAQDFLEMAQNEGHVVSREMQEKATALRVLLNRTWDDKPNDYEHALEIIERLRRALGQIVELEILDDGDMSTSGEIAVEALNGNHK